MFESFSSAPANDKKGNYRRANDYFRCSNTRQRWEKCPSQVTPQTHGAKGSWKYGARQIGIEIAKANSPMAAHAIGL
jgi:hypothetical protein